MLKIKSIVSSFIFLLFIGMGSYAHTVVNHDQQKSKSTKSNQKKEEKSSKKGDFEDEPKQTVERLDLFHAFSLVNAQLRWKEFYIEKYVKSIHNFSKTQNLEQHTSEEVSALIDTQIQTAEFPIQGCRIYISFEDTEKKNDPSFPGSRKNQANTIAYIQNCGTYPTSLS